MIYSSKGGVDFLRYSNVIEDMEMSFYYMKNVVSWSIIYISRWITNENGAISLVISIVLMFLNKIFTRSWSDIGNVYFILLLSFLSPVGVLLWLNIIREHIALILFFFGIIFLCKKENYRAMFLFSLSFLSHQVMFFFIIPFLAHQLIKKSVHRYSILLTVLLFSLLSVFSFQFEFELLNDEVEKLYAYIAYSSLIVMSFILVNSNAFYFLKEKKVFLKEYVVLMYFVFLSFSIFYNFPVWILNRIWIGFSFLVLLFIFSQRCKTLSLRWFIKVGVVMVNVVFMFFHSGVRGML